MTQDFSSSLESLSLPGVSAERPGPVFDFKRMLALRLPLMLGVAFLLAAASVPAAWFLTPLKFTATAELRFMARAPRVLYTDTEGTNASYDKFVNTQLGMITGNTILGRVLDSAAVRDLEIIRAQEDALAFLRGCVSATVNRNSELVTVTCTLADREAARLILDEAISLYMTYAMSEEAAAEADRLDALRRERDSRQQELQRQLQDLASFQTSPGVTLDPGEELTLYIQGKLNTETAIEEANRRLKEIDEQIARVDDLKNSGGIVYDYDVARTTEADPRVSSLQMTELQLTQGLDNLVEGSPQRVSLEKELKSTQSSLAEVRSRVQVEVLNSLRRQFELEREQVEKSLTGAQEQLAKFEELIGEYRSRLASTASEQNRYTEMRASVEKTRTLLDEVRQKITEIEVEKNAPARVRLNSEASVPTHPDYGRRYKMMLLALMASLAAGYGLGMVRELTDQQIRSPRDLTRVTRLPIVAVVPDSREDATLKEAYLPFLMADFPNSTCAEEFRRVLAYLLYTSEEVSGASSVLVASPSRGEGKTTLVCNLGIALAAANHRVLIVETSSRRPDIERCFRLERGPGLAELLHGEGEISDYIRETPFSGLQVLGPGLDSERLAGRLASRELLQFLSSVENEFDQVLFDTPPALLVSDAKLLAPVVDSVIVVAGAGVSTLGMVRRCLRDLEQGNARLLGMVLNRVRRLRGGYMADNLRMYYAYSRPYHGKGSPLPEMAIVGDSDVDATSEPVADMEIVDDDGVRRPTITLPVGGSRSDRSQDD